MKRLEKGDGIGGQAASLDHKLCDMFVFFTRHRVAVAFDLGLPTFTVSSMSSDFYLEKECLNPRPRGASQVPST